MTVLSDRVDALEATNATLVNLLNGLADTMQQTVDANQGPQGWSPVLTVQADGARSVLQIEDWINGGAGTTKPAVGGYIGSEGIVPTAAEAINIRGETGLTGSQGPTGDSGADGSVWHTGSGVPGSALGSDTDVYLDTSSGDFYERSGGVWTVVDNLIGPKGDTGDTGAQGDQGIPGADLDWVGLWVTSTAFVTNQAVQSNGSSYVCTSDHTSSATTKPGVGGSWQTVWDLLAAKGATGASGDGTGDMTAATYDPQAIAADVFDRNNHTGTQTLATISDAGSAAAAATGDFATVAQGNTADTAVQPADIGTAAPLNVSAAGDAAVGEIVKGDDTRLSDARTPTSHTHTLSNITDSGTAAGKDTGTAAGNVVELDGNGALPAVDGSNLTGVAGGSVLSAASVSGPAQTIDFDAASIYVSTLDSDSVTYTFSTTETVALVRLITGAVSGTPWNIEAASSDGVSFVPSSQNGDIKSVDFKPDGTKMYLFGDINDRFYQYTLSTPWDLSTASYDGVSFSVATQEDYSSHAIFSPDGNKFYLLGGNPDTIYQYGMSTPWDLSTASYDLKNFDFSSRDLITTSFAFKPDGTKLYLAGAVNDAIFQYTLSTAWDISTASYDNKSFALTAPLSSALYISFKPDGKKMYLGSGLHQYTLSTPWDVSTASYDSVGGAVSGDQGAHFKADGTKVYLVNNDVVSQYSIVDSPTLVFPSEMEAPDISIFPGQKIALEIITTDGGTSYQVINVQEGIK